MVHTLCAVSLKKTVIDSLIMRSAKHNMKLTANHKTQQNILIPMQIKTHFETFFFLSI